MLKLFVLLHVIDTFAYVGARGARYLRVLVALELEMASQASEVFVFLRAGRAAV